MLWKFYEIHRKTKLIGAGVNGSYIPQVPPSGIYLEANEDVPVN